MWYLQVGSLSEYYSSIYSITEDLGPESKLRVLHHRAHNTTRAIIAWCLNGDIPT